MGRQKRLDPGPQALRPPDSEGGFMIHAVVAPHVLPGKVEAFETQHPVQSGPNAQEVA